MRGRYKVLLAVLVLAAGVVVVFWLAQRPSGVFAAKYQGHTLVYWVGRYMSTTDGPYGGLREALELRKEAVASICFLCSNNLPEVAQALNHDPGPRQAGVETGTSWLPLKVRKWLVAGPLADHAEERARAAEIALRMLGADAAPAIPEVEKLALSPNAAIARRASYNVLPFLGTNSVPWLLPLMADEKHPRQAYAAYALLTMTRNMRTNTSPTALPVLLQCLQSTNSATVWCAAASLGNMQLEPGLCIPALTSALANTNPEVRSAVTIALGKFHENARAALPGLVQVHEASGSDVGFQPAGVVYQVPGQTPPGAYTNVVPASAVPSVRELLFERPGLPKSR